MKKIINLLAIIVFTTIIVSCKPSREDAIKYNDALVNEEVLVIQAESAFSDAVVNNKQEELDKLYDAFSKQVQLSILTVSNIKPLGDDSKFKDATMGLLSAYESVVKQEYAEVLKIAKVPDEEYTEEHNNKMNELSKKIDEKLDKEVQNFLNAQKEMSSKYNITLSTSKNNNTK